MRRITALLIAAALLAGVAGLAGCSGGGNTETGKSDLKVTEENGRLKVEAEESGAEAEKKKLTEEAIGIPVYPGAQMDEEAADSTTKMKEEGKTVWVSAVLYTEDPVSDVVSWYRTRLEKKPGFIDISATQESEEVGLFMFQSGDAMKTVTISKGDVDHPGKTIIRVALGSGAEIPDMNK